MNTPDTPEAVIRSLAQHLDGAGEGKPALKKVLLAHLKHLKPLRPTAGNADLESFYTVAAWYLTPTYLLKQPAVANDTDIIKGSRRITAMSHLSQVWGATAVTRVRCFASTRRTTLTGSDSCRVSPSPAAADCPRPRLPPNARQDCDKGLRSQGIPQRSSAIRSKSSRYLAHREPELLQARKPPLPALQPRGCVLQRRLSAKVSAERQSHQSTHSHRRPPT